VPTTAIVHGRERRFALFGRSVPSGKAKVTRGLDAVDNSVENLVGVSPTGCVQRGTPAYGRRVLRAIGEGFPDIGVDPRQRRDHDPRHGGVRRVGRVTRVRPVTTRSSHNVAAHLHGEDGGCGNPVVTGR